MAVDKLRLLQEGGQRLGLDLDDEACRRLEVYCAELLKWSQRINLIARDTPEAQVIENHFLDSLALLPLLRDHETAPVHLLDVGSGAGFPGLALASVLPDMRFTLVEPRQKRVSFLKHVIRTLRLTNTEVVAERIETHAAAWQGRFTHVTSRAVADPGIFLPLVRPLLTPEVRVILMLAREEAMHGIGEDAASNWQLIETRKFTLPFSGAPRLLAVVCAR